MHVTLRDMLPTASCVLYNSGGDLNRFSDNL